MFTSFCPLLIVVRQLGAASRKVQTPQNRQRLQEGFFYCWLLSGVSHEVLRRVFLSGIVPEGDAGRLGSTRGKVQVTALVGGGRSVYNPTGLKHPKFCC